MFYIVTICMGRGQGRVDGWRRIVLKGRRKVLGRSRWGLKSGWGVHRMQVYIAKQRRTGAVIVAGKSLKYLLLSLQLLMRAGKLLWKQQKWYFSLSLWQFWKFRFLCVLIAVAWEFVTGSMGSNFYFVEKILLF